MKKKIALTLLIVVILLGIGGVYAYFATSAFKTDKELFFSYMTSDLLSNLKDENLKEYIKKQENNAYTNKGSIALEVQDDGSISDETLQIIKNSKVTFEGKTDNSKKVAEQTLTMELAQGINIPVKVRRDGETLGIQSNLLNTKFIAVRNENLKNLIERLGADAEDVPDKIDFEESTFTESEIKELKEKYFSILDENLDEELFSKEKENDQTTTYITKDIYPVIEHKYNSTIPSVEAAIRHAIYRCWNGNKSYVCEILGYDALKCPSNAEFLNALALYSKYNN